MYRACIGDHGGEEDSRKSIWKGLQYIIDWNWAGTFVSTSHTKNHGFFLLIHYRMGRFWPYSICNILELIIFAWAFIDIFWHVFLLQLEKFLLEKLDVYESAVGDSNVKCTPRIAGFPPAFQAISRNPIVLDLAYNMIEFPPIENRMKKDRKAKGGFISRIFGWVYLIRVFDKYWQLIWWFLLWNIVMNFEMLCTIQIFERSRYLEILQ